jgi:SsrA-binding protein
LPEAHDDHPIASNKKARFNFEILETVEAGMLLLGSEVKSLRDRQASISDSFARIERGECYLYNFDISPYAVAGPSGEHASKRKRKLLLHTREIRKLVGKTSEKGLTLIPLKVYFNHRGFAKVLLGLAKGKSTHDKRDSIKARDAKRDIARAYGRRGRS